MKSQTSPRYPDHPYMSNYNTYLGSYEGWDLYVHQQPHEMSHSYMAYGQAKEDFKYAFCTDFYYGKVPSKDLEVLQEARRLYGRMPR